MKYFGWKGYFLVEDKKGMILGVCTYKDINGKYRSCELAFQLYKSEQMYAIDTNFTLLDFLFKELNLSRLYSFVPVFFAFENRVYKKTGFVQEGNLREGVFWDGKYHDILAYALLREEFTQEEK